MTLFSSMAPGAIRNIVKRALYSAKQRWDGAAALAHADSVLFNSDLKPQKLAAAFKAGLDIIKYDGQTCQQAAYAHDHRCDQNTRTILIRHKEADGKVVTRDDMTYDYHAISAVKCADTGKIYVWDPKDHAIYLFPTYISQQLKNSPELTCTLDRANGAKDLFWPANRSSLMAQLPGDKEYEAQITKDAEAHFDPNKD